MFKSTSPRETFGTEEFVILDAADTHQITRFMLTLDADARRDRFHTAMSDAAIIDHCHRLDWARTSLMGWRMSGVLVGLAELHVGNASDAVAECALVVNCPGREGVIGAALLSTAACEAGRRGIDQLQASLDAERLPALGLEARIVRSMGGRIDHARGLAVLALDPAGQRIAAVAM